MKPSVIALAIVLTAVNAGAALINLSVQVRADVAGMGYYELRKDRDFRRAVEAIVTDCSVSGDSISC
jgi:hypothetical protein